MESELLASSPGLRAAMADLPRHRAIGWLRERRGRRGRTAGGRLGRLGGGRGGPTNSAACPEPVVEGS